MGWKCTNCGLPNGYQRILCQACFMRNNASNALNVKHCTTANNKQFTWSIPSLSHQKHELLCHGYVRDNYNKHITKDILRLIMHSYCYDLFSIKDVTNCSVRQRFISHIFQIEGWKFFLEIWPNGCNENNEGQIRLFICLVLIPRHVFIRSTYTLSLKETNTVCMKTSFFSENKTYASWPKDILKFTEIKNLSTITIQCEMNSFSPTIHIKHSPFLKSSPAIYRWIIEDESQINKMKNASRVYGFASPIFEVFGLKWWVSIYPNSPKVTNPENKYYMYLFLASLANPDMEVYVKQTLFVGNNVDETILIHNKQTHVADGLDARCSCGTREELLKMNRFYIVAQIELIDVYLTKSNSAEGKDVGTINVTNDFMMNGDSIIVVNDYISSEFTWNISSEMMLMLRQQDEEEIFQRFKMFNLDWMVGINNRGNVRLKVRGIPKIETVDVVSIRCYMSLIELNVRYVMKGIFDVSNCELCWGNSRVIIERFQELEHCTIRLKMDLIDVHFDGRNITDQYIKML